MASDQSILVTGGAGFIGSHTVVQLLNEGFRVSIIDNLDNAVEEAVHMIRELVGPELSQKLEFNLVRSIWFEFGVFGFLVFSLLNEIDSELPLLLGCRVILEIRTISRSCFHVPSMSIFGFLGLCFSY